MTLRRWLPVLLSVAVNVVTVVGVVAWGWPPANVLILFLIENFVIGIVTAIRLATLPETPISSLVMFCAFYGVLLLVHAVFVALVVWRLGASPTFLLLAVPVILIVLRSVLELVNGWFLGGGRTSGVSARAVMQAPTPRIAVLHISVLIAFVLLVTSPAGRGGLVGALEGLFDFLRDSGLELDRGGYVILIMMAVKTFVDLRSTWQQAEVDAR